MKVDVLLGLQWGDEGKGKVVDVLTPKYDVVARFQGGPNAGHTLEFKGEKYVLRSIPSGIFQGGKINVIGNGVVLDPVLFKEEAEALAASGHDITKQLYISKKAHLILPTHRILDAAYEAAKGAGKIGTTGKGIGPTYTDKISRNGVRVGDLLRDFDSIYSAAKARHEAILKSLNYDYDITELEAKWFDALNYLKQFKLIDSEHFINNLLKDGKNVLAEGAQGTMLDVDFGSYPFVTSSNTICAGCCTGLGVAPRNIGQEEYKIPEVRILRALLTAGMVGNIVKTNGSISGAEVGCQGEVGVACAMAGAAVCYLLGGSIYQCEYAAEMGLEHHLGLTCDPLKGLVQIPCIERNGFACMRAVDHASYAMVGDGRHKISFDDVVEVMMETGHALPSLYRETSMGGLARVYEV